MSKNYKGYVTLPRDVQLLPLWDNPHDTVLWLYCLLHASHQPYKELQAGQFYASQKKIAEELKWSRKTVGTCLHRLENKEMLRVETSDLGTIITVMHWEEISSGRGLDEGPDDSNEYSNHGYYSGNDTSRSYSTDRSTKPDDEYGQFRTSTERQHREEQFDQFWKIYPRKCDKAETRRVFMEMMDDADSIIAATEDALSSKEWLKEDGRFIPNPLKWLDGMWEQYKPAEYNYEAEVAAWKTE